MVTNEVEEGLREALRIAQENYTALVKSNAVQAALARDHEDRWHAIYRVVFPEEFPWARDAGITVFNFDKLIRRIKSLRAMDDRATVPPAIYG